MKGFFIDLGLFFCLFYIFYRIYFKYAKKDYKKLKSDDYIKLYIARYNLDVRKTKYKTILNTLALVNSLILSITGALIVKVKGYALKVLVCFFVLFVLIYALSEISGRYLKNKEDK